MAAVAAGVAHGQRQHGLQKRDLTLPMTDDIESAASLAPPQLRPAQPPVSQPVQPPIRLPTTYRVLPPVRMPATRMPVVHELMAPKVSVPPSVRAALPADVAEDDAALDDKAADLEIQPLEGTRPKGRCPPMAGSQGLRPC